MIMDWLIIITAACAGAFLFSPAMRNAPLWLATVTPLASIIGSGFLVAAPLLAAAAGRAAPAAMLAIVALAYAIGGVIRFNIRYVETLLEQGASPVLSGIERLSDFALAAAYVTSVAFYLRLLSAFILRAANIDNMLLAELLTTSILLFIGGYGLWRGLGGLERLEEYSVNIKLAIVLAMLAGLLLFDVRQPWDIATMPPMPVQGFGHTLRVLAGILLIVQGFETSRYLGAAHSREMRMKSMRYAQYIAAVIYVAFVLLALPLLPHLPEGVPDETGIITIAAIVSPLLTGMLFVAAVMSQFSAAIADTLGSGGLLSENTHHRVRENGAYAVISLVAILLVWTANVFEIITLASRAFAFYYMLQTVNAWLAAGRVLHGKQRILYQSGFCLLALLLCWIVVCAIPSV